MLDPRQIRSFLAVAQAGSFVGAADTLDLSKAAVSRHVADLESHLGTRLLHRTTRRLSLTDAGLRFQDRASELLIELDELESEMSESAQHATGVLRINAPFTFGVMHLAPLWPRFLDENPKVSLQIDLSDRVVDLVEEGYDLTVRIARLEDSQLVSRRLATTRMVLCASPAYLAQHGTPNHPRQLSEHRIIAYSYWSGGDDWSFEGDGGTVRVRVRPCMHSNSGDTCRVAALNDHGVILQPDFLVGPDLQQGRLIELLPEFRALELGIYAIYPTRKHVPLRVRRLVDFLIQAFRDPTRRAAWWTSPAT